MISVPSICRWAGPIIDVLLDYVGQVTLCSRLTEHLDSFPDWSVIKEKSGNYVEQWNMTFLFLFQLNPLNNRQRKGGKTPQQQMNMVLVQRNSQIPLSGSGPLKSSEHVEALVTGTSSVLDLESQSAVPVLINRIKQRPA